MYALFLSIILLCSAQAYISTDNGDLKFVVPADRSITFVEGGNFYSFPRVSQDLKAHTDSAIADLNATLAGDIANAVDGAKVCTSCLSFFC